MANSTLSLTSEEASVLFETNLASRTYILNREKKLNALNEDMLSLLRPVIQEWDRAELCHIIIGTGKGRAFCAGGDVERVVADAADEESRPKALNFFKQEFEMDHILATLDKPYVAICDGITMGGGVGLVAHAPFRVATENTLYAMPETKIGYAPDVGANHFLSRLDGEIGTFLALTGSPVKGRAVFELGLATHYVPSRRIPQLVGQLATIEERNYDKINETIEEFYEESETLQPHNSISGDIRLALDSAFRYRTVEEIITSLQNIAERSPDEVGDWAKQTLSELTMRSPTSLKVSLEAIRRGKDMNLREVLQMELNIATAFCSGASPDFHTGVTAVIKEKLKTRPAWSPNTVEDVELEMVLKQFFDPSSQYVRRAPQLSLPRADAEPKNFMQFALPTETEIEKILRGQHETSGDLAYDLSALIKKFNSLRRNKRGVEEKLREVTSRHCDIVENDTGYKELRWKTRR
ncbi:3-hydroxyisobutyryl-coenzyme A hydrolase [Rickenella mellea]|uniref:3-hydroxyisobutyryl-CoA hydrolase n=1 Tax=Rickenella mellea TaxID=50990 RepID=A0A4Y7QB71_9AGAM|nr:3-hydroxyisobutyryl-coenzyme A hydrolase [Rickenella mellea]